MQRNLCKFPLFCITLTLGTSALAAPPPASAPPAKSETETPITKVDAEQARRDLEQMREQMREMSKKMAELSMQLGDVGPRAYAYRYLGNPDRGMIGVVLANDEHGARITAVTPGGPADKAGIRNGDVIVTVQGKDSKKTVVEDLHDLKVGEDLKLDILRGGKNSVIALKTERREPYNLAYAFTTPEAGDANQVVQLDSNATLPREFDNNIRIEVEDAMRQTQMSKEQAEELRKQTDAISKQSKVIAMRAGEQARHAIEHISMSMPWWGLNLTNLNPDLGAYFGVEHGVLVLSADADASKTLKSGDVLLAVGGKKVERPEDALRLLREQSTGSEVKIEVLRQHKAQTLSMRAPEFKSMFAPPSPPPPAPPLPALAPIPPLPPMATIAPPTPVAPAPPAPPPPPPPEKGSN